MENENKILVDFGSLDQPSVNDFMLSVEDAKNGVDVIAMDSSSLNKKLSGRYSRGVVDGLVYSAIVVGSIIVWEKAVLPGVAKLRKMINDRKNKKATT